VTSKHLTARCAARSTSGSLLRKDSIRNSTRSKAQREAAEAYVASQWQLGWVLLAERYDDGGNTGANLERPALRRLLEDIERGTVGCVLVYKIDRLSRSLLDFARLIEVFERHHVSLVSVTQPLNTTASLGRPTLNILLSFAQFEREMISDRTRDKMAAARRKGKWVGGTPVLGYDIAATGSRLLVNPEEAERVRAIFELYLQHGALETVLAELQQRRWTTKSWRARDGIEHAGQPFAKAGLERLLRNVLYVGRSCTKGSRMRANKKPSWSLLFGSGYNSDLAVSPRGANRRSSAFAGNLRTRYTLPNEYLGLRGCWPWRSGSRN
jgi:site-specific DNA recombinase